jgi:hypothetical protein
MLNTLVATAAFALVIGAVAPTSAGAASITFNTSDSQFDAGVDNQGWWSATRPASDSNANYAVGDDVNGDVIRNFLTFDLATLDLSNQTIVSATFEAVKRLVLETAPTATVPKPTSMLLVGTGLLGLAARRHRRP